MTLDEVIDGRWSHEPQSRAVTHSILPDGCVDVMLEQRAGQPWRASIFGATARRSDATIEAGVRAMGIRFRPWVGGQLFGLKGGALMDRVTPIEVPCTGLEDLARFFVERLKLSNEQRLVREAYSSIGSHFSPLISWNTTRGLLTASS